MITVFATTKDLTIFQNRKDFGLEDILAVVDNFSTITVFNTKHLFIGSLISANEYSIAIVSSSNYKSTHYSLVKVTVCNNTGKV